MPFVKVPGTDREIWFDRHEPEGPETPWFVSAGHEISLTPEQFSSECAADGFEGTVTNVKVEYLVRDGIGLLVRSALRYEKARKKLITGHSGRRRRVFGFTALEDLGKV